MVSNTCEASDERGSLVGDAGLVGYRSLIQRTIPLLRQERSLGKIIKSRKE